MNRLKRAYVCVAYKMSGVLPGSGREGIKFDRILLTTRASEGFSKKHDTFFKNKIGFE